MSKYVLELMDRDTFINHLCDTHDEIERITNPTTYTMNGFKAQVFSREQIDGLESSEEISRIRESSGTLIKVVEVLVP